MRDAERLNGLGEVSGLSCSFFLCFGISGRGTFGQDTLAESIRLREK